MSSVAPFPSIETAAWSQLELQHKQNGQAPQFTSQHHSPNSSDSPSHFPRDRHQYPLISDSVQAYQASAQSVDLQSLVIPEHHPDTFSFDDYLTPEYSQEDNTFSTPEIQDLAWQATYNVQADQRENHSNSIDPTFEVSSTLQETNNTDNKLASHNLPSPQLTSTPIPLDHPIHSKQSSLSSNLFPHSPVTAFHGTKRPVVSIDTAEPKHILTGTGTHSMRTMATQALSPVIRVDSPALEPVQNSQRTSQHYQSNERSNLWNESPRRNSQQGTRLMPPSQPGDEEWEEEATERGGVAPDARNDQLISSVNDIAKQQEHAHTVESVTTWLARTNMHFPALAEISNRQNRNRLQKDRLRSRSTGSHTEVPNVPILSDDHVPGPGLLVEEESTYYYSDGDDDGGSEMADSDANSAERASTPPTEFPPVQDIEDEDVAPDEDAPLPKQFLRRGPWQDAVRFQLPVSDSRIHPESSNAAMALYDRQAARFETASRAATWGTGRRASESEIASIMDEGKTRHLSLSQKTRVRGVSFMQEARNAVHNLIPRRSNSNAKKTADSTPGHGEVERVQSAGAPGNKSPPLTTRTGVRRPSFHRQKSPSTSNAFLAMTGNLAAVGASGSGVNLEADPPKSPLLRALSLKRTRSKSEVPKSPQSTSGISELQKPSAGATGPSLASPLQGRRTSEIGHESVGLSRDLDMSNTGIRMELSVYESNARDIIPTLDGFQNHARGLNPRLPPFLIERIGQDQLRRYKRLVKGKIDHKRAVEVDKSCESGQHCLALGGEVKLFPPRTNTKDPSSNTAQFKVSNSGDSEVDEGAFDGVVTPALFPDGIPLPPTKRLPAKFECPLCFQVKSFQKPSDWTKHVHEDVQPFSCTFPNCPDPKSFKRKADWVRHENERHRHLEWWQCNLNDCTHVCYRKDNFVQHLVREHKKKEPKVKGRGSSTSSKAKGKDAGIIPTNGEEFAFWSLVESCRCESPTDPRHEPCKFCGNTCATWKKLSVHVGKHMEQIAMPVLELVKARTVTKDTTLSPVEQNVSRMANHLATDTLGPDSNALSPFTMSAASNYQSSSAGHSPIPMQVRPQRVPLNTNTYYNSGMMVSDVHSAPISASPYGASMTFTPNSGYDPYATYAEQAQYPAFGAHTATYPPANTPHGAHQQLPRQAQHSHQHHQPHLPSGTPRSQPMETGYTSMPMEGMPGQYYNNGQAFYSSPEIEHSYMHNYGANIMGGGNMMGVPVSSPMEGREASVGHSQRMQDEYQYPGTSNTQHGYFG